ncbi:MAG: GMC family oxidoreductase [Rhodospirillales bacterium]|nr:GMC family oxidoreductase [Rhodospirillales bacterium]
MIDDARTIPDGSVLRFDICIVGAGAAGITLAREFEGQSFSVLLVESGSFEFNDRTQALYAGEISQGLYELDVSRLRYFGGCTNHWGGVCRPFDADDFSTRPWIPDSGWPITIADVAPYYDPACDIVQLPTKHWDNVSWEESLAEFYRLPFMGKRIAGAIFQLSPPTRFGEVYREPLEQSANVRTLLNANVVEIAADPSGRHVTALRVACLDGPNFSITARIVVIAMGAVETARLMLASNAQSPAGIGNSYDLVGRYYANHPGFYAADIVLSEPADVMARPLSAMQTILPRLIVTPQEAAREQLAKFSAWANPVSKDGRLDPSDGYVALRSLFRDIRRGQLPSDLMDKLGRLLGDLDGTARDIWNRTSAATMIRLDPEWETVPNPDSRVTLIAERDSVGMQKVRVDWRLSTLDIHTVQRSIEIIGEVVGEAGFGRVHVHEWLQSGPTPSTFPGHENYHPASTTRMSDDTKRGVVDRHCRVHGIDNLYIAGASVFPTVSAVNPTLTVVALSLRLAEHLKSSMA